MTATMSSPASDLRPAAGPPSSSTPATPVGRPFDAQWQPEATPPLLSLSGDWSASLAGRSDAVRRAATHTGALRIDASGLGAWDSALAAELWPLWQRVHVAHEDVSGLETLPEGMCRVMRLAGLPRTPEIGELPSRSPTLRLFKRLGLAGSGWVSRQRETLAFFGEVAQGFARLVTAQARMRFSDLWLQIDLCGPRSLPIVSLISFLVGLILAYMGAAQLRRFGAQVYIADLVSIGMVREIGALMTAVILAGRVGAAFAAQLGSMQANEEIDALNTMGIPPIEHLVLPRVLAMLLVSPLLTAYSGLVGCVAGFAVATLIFDVAPFEYVHQSINALSLQHLGVGLFKGTVYGVLVALAGCLQGLRAGRSAQAVGQATTQSVVQAIVWVVVAASALTILFQRLSI